MIQHKHSTSTLRAIFFTPRQHPPRYQYYLPISFLATFIATCILCLPSLTFISAYYIVDRGTANHIPFLNPEFVFDSTYFPFFFFFFLFLFLFIVLRAFPLLIFPTLSLFFFPPLLCTFTLTRSFSWSRLPTLFSIHSPQPELYSH